MNPGLVYLYMRCREGGLGPKEAISDARHYLDHNPAEHMRMLDGSFRKYTDVGCYPVFYLTRRDGVLCATCAADDPDDPVRVADINYEDAQLYCDDCNERIESAYAESGES